MFNFNDRVKIVISNDYPMVGLNHATGKIIGQNNNEEWIVLLDKPLSDDSTGVVMFSFYLEKI